MEIKSYRMNFETMIEKTIVRIKLSRPHPPKSSYSGPLRLQHGLYSGATSISIKDSLRLICEYIEVIRRGVIRK